MTAKAGATSTNVVERRRVQRVKLIEPLRGQIDSLRIYVVDVSLRGVRIAHQESIGGIGDVVTLRTVWDGRNIELRCQLVRTVIHRAPSSATGRTLYHSGAVIKETKGASAFALRALVEWHIVRAIDEQKANARGVPAMAAQSFQTGNASVYKRHELVAGRWRETTTSDPTQPQNGFTVAATHTPAEVEMLRSAFERGDHDTGGRELIWRLAQLSISSAEGIPTRRFMP